MSQCTAITRGGERCRGVAIDASGLCYSHSPNHADARKRAARKGGQRGGRGRPATELFVLKSRLEGLAEDVLAGHIDRSDAAVAGQLFNYAIRAVSVGLKAREQEEFEARLAEIEEALERQRGAPPLMGLRDKLARLEKAMQGNLQFIELADGSRYWFDPQETGIELFRYLSDSLHAVYHGESRPEPSEVLKAMANAKDRERAFSQLPLGNFLPLDAEALVERGELVPPPLIAGRDVDEPDEDLSEP